MQQFNMNHCSLLGSNGLMAVCSNIVLTLALTYCVQGVYKLGNKDI